MMDFVCPLAFHHKKGEYFVEFLLSGGVYVFGWSLWSLDCIQVLHFVLYIFSSCHAFDGIFMLGGVFFFFFFFFLLLVLSMFLVSNCLLIYIYELFIDICIYCVLFEIKNLICLLVLFSHMRLCILFSVSGDIHVDLIELLSILATDGQQLGLNLFYEHYFVKGFLFCKL